MLNALGISFMAAAGYHRVWLRDVPSLKENAQRQRKWFYWRGRPWRPVDPDKL